MTLDDCLDESPKTMAQIAKEIGVSEPALSMWASGKRTPGYNNMIKLREYFSKLDTNTFYEK